jgi:3-oxoacyl-[acyl-carrier protein] reductase
MKLGIEGRTALVTGAGRGLGEGICRELASEGVTVIASARTEADLQNLINGLPNRDRHHYFVADFSAKDGVESLVDYMKKTRLQPDIVVNNVGGNLDFTDPLGPSSEWRQVMSLNVEVAIDINRAVIPSMRQKKWGRICHVSSISALENQGPPAYCAAKSALNAYVRSLGRYVASDNVILTSIMPGAVFTTGGYWDIAGKSRPEHVEKYLSERMAIKRFGDVEEISGVVAFLVSERASFCVGSCVLVDGGQGRVFYPTDL